jgi:hypothetical protein
MESYNSDCENANKDYIKKYDTLISMVNGYDQINDDKSLNELTDLTGKIKKIINKTLISETDFVKLKKEQNNIMNEYEKLEEIKTGDPFSKVALEFTEQDNVSSDTSNLYDKIEKKFNINIEGKPQSKNIKLSKMPLEQKLSCDGSINQYYKMPDICININTNKSKSKSMSKSKSSIHKSKQKPKPKVQPKPKPKSKPKVQSKPKPKSKPKVQSKPKPKVKSKPKPKIKTIKNLKCLLNNKINNHKIF